MSLEWIVLAGVVLVCPAMMYLMMRGGSHGSHVTPAVCRKTPGTGRSVL